MHTLFQQAKDLLSPEATTERLHHYVINGNLEGVNFCLATIDVDARNESGMTPLMSANWACQFSMMSLLIEKGASVNTELSNTRSGLDRTILKQAINHRYWSHHYWNNEKNEAIKLLLKHGATLEPELLHYYAKVGDLQEVGCCLKTINVNARNEEGLTPLMVAARGNQLLSVRMLIEKGAKVNTVNPNEHRMTALSLASLTNGSEIFLLLLEAGANKLNDSYNPGHFKSAFSGKTKTTIETLYNKLLKKERDQLEELGKTVSLEELQDYMNARKAWPLSSQVARRCVSSFCPVVEIQEEIIKQHLMKVTSDFLDITVEKATVLVETFYPMWHRVQVQKVEQVTIEAEASQYMMRLSV